MNADVMDTARHASVKKFIFHNLPKITGYLDPQDALVFATLVEGQQRSRITGGIAEIGVYFGRSYYLLRTVSSPETNIVAVDIFDSNAIGSDSDQYSTFLQNGRRLQMPVDENLVITADSTTLSPAEIVERCGPVRFFSIDGGHSLDDVKADSNLASACLSDDGIIAFDDAHNPRWPEVTIGVSDFIRRNEGKFSVLAFTRFKAYVCRVQHQSFYRDVVMNAPNLACLDKEEVEYLGSKAIFLQVPAKRRILYEMFQRLRLPSLAERAFCDV